MTSEEGDPETQAVNVTEMLRFQTSKMVSRLRPWGQRSRDRPPQTLASPCAPPPRRKGVPEVLTHCLQGQPCSFPPSLCSLVPSTCNALLPLSRPKSLLAARPPLAGSLP